MSYKRVVNDLHHRLRLFAIVVLSSNSTRSVNASPEDCGRPGQGLAGGFVYGLTVKVGQAWVS